MPPLEGAVADVRSRIAKIRGRGGSMNELNTRSTLIEPIIEALGWDTRNTAEVDREYRRKPTANPVDFALLLLGSPRLFIEAKALGMDLHDDRWTVQVLSYAAMSGVEWCVLTNGDEYRLYNAHAAVDVDGKLFRRFKLSDAAQHAFAVSTLQLLSKDKLTENLISVLWKAQFIDRRVEVALHDLFEEPDAALVRLVQKRAPELKPADVRDSIRRADLKVKFPTEIAAARGTLPRTAPAAPVQRRVAAAPARAVRKAPKASGVTLKDLIAAGLIKTPLALECDYKRTHFEAQVQGDGRVAFAGTSYESLSTAAGEARATVIGIPEGLKRPATNGWVFWRYRDPETGRLTEIDALRRRYLAAGGSR